MLGKANPVTPAVELAQKGVRRFFREFGTSDLQSSQDEVTGSHGAGLRRQIRTARSFVSRAIHGAEHLVDGRFFIGKSLAGAVYAVFRGTRCSFYIFAGKRIEDQAQNFVF